GTRSNGRALWRGNGAGFPSRLECRALASAEFGDVNQGSAALARWRARQLDSGGNNALWLAAGGLGRVLINAQIAASLFTGAAIGCPKECTHQAPKREPRPSVPSKGTCPTLI